MNPLFSLRPFTVHEGEIALYHAWSDGTPVHGPMARHLQSGLLAKFKAGLKISASPEGECMSPFSDWRMNGRARGRTWSIESSAPLGAITDADGEITSLPEMGTPLIVVIRFYCQDSEKWRVHQFHDAELADFDSSDANEIMITGYRFRAGWQEYFGGSGAENLPSLEPRLRGVIEWHHGGRTIPCWYHDAETNTWTESDENVYGSGEDVVRYVSLEQEGSSVAISYLTPRTGTAALTGQQITALSWIDARAIQVLESSGLILEPGWTLQTVGCPEPITLPSSGRHWEHPVVRFRFLDRLYATLAHGIFSLPAIDPLPEANTPFDFPIRLGHLMLLPHTAYITP